MAKTKYEKLMEDLMAAIEDAEEVAHVTEDDGTCNFDSMMIYLPRWNHEKVFKAERVQESQLGIVTVGNILCSVFLLEHKQTREPFKQKLWQTR